MDPETDDATEHLLSVLQPSPPPCKRTYPIMGPPPPAPSPIPLPDPSILGLGNARSPALQTIFSPADITEFLTLFGITTPLPLTRLDIPRGVNFKCWLLHAIDEAQQAEKVPARVKAWDVKMPLHWTFPGADKVWGGESVWTFCMKSRNTYEFTVDAVYAFLSRIGVEASERLLYHGATRHETRVSVAGFKPSCAPRYGCADLGGPGVYLLPDMELALAYAGVNGVLWVFRQPDLGELEVLQLEPLEWVKMAAAGNGVFWGLRMAVRGYSRCDVVYGCVSEDTGPATLQRVPPVPVVGSEQYCFKSVKAFGALAKGLVGMVFLDEELG